MVAMKISVLYFEGCPNHAPAVERVRSFVTEQGLNVTVEEREVTSHDDVARLRFLGSPTVQVDGVDIEAAARVRTDFAMSCRLYQTPDGLPSAEMLRQALGVSHADSVKEEPVDKTAAALESCSPSGFRNSMKDVPRDRRERRLASVATVGSVAAAALSSACCWLPLLLIAFGVSAAGVAGFFERWRWPMAGVAGVLLAIGFFLTYRTVPATGADCCAQRLSARRLRRASLWVASVFVAAMVLFPNYVRALIGPAGSIDDATVARATLSVPVDGMTCDGCAATLEKRLKGLAGVASVRVSYADGAATIAVGEDNVQTRERIAAAIRDAGFEPGEPAVQLPEQAVTVPAGSIARSSEAESGPGRLTVFGDSLEPLIAAFNRYQDQPRVVALLSPT